MNDIHVVWWAYINTLSIQNYKELWLFLPDLGVVLPVVVINVHCMYEKQMFILLSFHIPNEWIACYDFNFC